MELELHDFTMIGLNKLTQEDIEGLFHLEQMVTMPYEKNDHVWLSLTIERSLSMQSIERTVYTGFDFLSDVGGLSGILVSALVVFVNAWNYAAFDNYMVTNLYKMKEPDDPKTQ